MRPEPGPSERTSVLPSGTVTFLFTDIEGSTQRWEGHREAMAKAVAQHDALLRSAMETHSGHIFKTIGDAYCVAFRRPQEAIAAAIDAQRVLRAEDFSAVDGLRIRMALHTGTTNERDGDYFGPVVNRVARLMSIGHGGQVLVSGATRELARSDLSAGVSLIDLGLHRLKDLAEPEQVWQLTIEGISAEFPPLRSLDSLPNNLPYQATSFIGRDVEVAEIGELLKKSRLVTLIGTGGIGKTRVALQVGADNVGHSRDGVWFVDLAQVADPDYGVPAIMSALGMRQFGGSPLLDQMVLFLKHKQLLLILDNCEQIINEASCIVASILRDCVGVTILATSREHLNVRGEQVYRMPSLAAPAPGRPVTTEEALRYPAVALFVARACAVDERFALTEDTAKIAADICRRLDGIALAIELASARVTVLSLRQLYERLDKSFALLTGGDRAALPRYQTMKGAIEWSYELLTDDEKRLFRRLSIFRGGWTLDAATAITDDAGAGDFAVIERLGSLVNKSLVVTEAGLDAPRYRLLESLRQYGAERLNESAETQATARRHAGFFSQFVQEQINEGTEGTTFPTVYSRIEEEIDNIRAALEWSVAQRNDTMLGAKVAERLGLFWYVYHCNEGRRWIEMAQREVAGQHHSWLSVALALALTRSISVTAPSETQKACEQALKAARELGDEHLLLRALDYYGEVLLYEDRLEEAEPLIREALDLAEKLNKPARIHVSLHFLSVLNRKRGKLDGARELSDRAMQVGMEVNLFNAAMTLLDRSYLEKQAGGLVSAIEWARKAQALAQSIRAASLEILAENCLGVYLCMSGEVEAPRMLGQSMLRHSRDEFSMYRIPAAIKILAGVAFRLDNLETAARLMGYAESRSPEKGGEQAEYGEVVREWIGPILSERLNETDLSEFVAQGETWSEDRAVEEALKL